MIEVQDIARAILFNLNEMYARKHSDPELIEAINSILRLVNMALINYDSNWVVKEMNLKVKNGKSTLPEDFAKLKGITAVEDDVEKQYDGDYKVVGHSIYINDTAKSMDYYFVIPEVETMEDEIDLPPFFLELFIRYATGLLDGTLGQKNIDKLVSDEVQSLCSASNYPVIERPMEFYV